MTNVLLVGAGAREHAIARALHDAGANIYAVMKTRNPGIARLAKEFVLDDHNSPERVTQLPWVRKGVIDFAFIGPEVPLINGMADALEEHGVPVVGPKKNAAIIEGSKAFMRELMENHRIPGLVEYRVFNEPNALKDFLEGYDKEFVIKPIGVTGGKGVWVMGDHFQSREQGYEYAERVLKEGIGGSKRVLIEEKLMGEEFTLQVFTDGKELRAMPMVQDFKRAYEGDKGPNTGGMGSYSMENHLLPFMREEDRDEAIHILQKIVDAMRAEGREYRGILYGQFMLTPSGPKVIELNCRFGDPEAMNVLSVLNTSLVEISEGIINGALPEVEFMNMATVVKYVVPAGYGTSKVKKGIRIDVDEKAIEKEGAELYFASVHEEDGSIYTTGSRSMAVVGVANELESAEKIAERALKHIKGEVFSRHDIATREVIEKKLQRMRKMRKEE